MDPSLTKSEVIRANEADLRALDVIGWDIALDAGPALRAGDADQDMDFDQRDLVRVQIAGKYLSGQPATWGEGDWDAAPGGSQGRPPDGDHRFDQKDIVSALQGGAYLTGSYSALIARADALGAGFGDIGAGDATEPGWSKDSPLSDLAVAGTKYGDEFGATDITYAVIPEPCTLSMTVIGAFVFIMGLVFSIAKHGANRRPPSVALQNL